MPQKEKLPSKALDGSKGSYNQIKQMYREAHFTGLNIADSVPNGNPKLKEKASELKECRSWFELRHYPQFDGQRAESKVTRGYSCKNYRLCPACAMARSRKVTHSISQKIDALDLAQGDLFLFTVTVRNTETFESGLSTVREFYNKLVQGRADVKKKKSSVPFAPFGAVDGWIGHFETTKSEAGWHPHFHFLITPNHEDRRLFEIDPALEPVKDKNTGRVNYYPKKGCTPTYKHNFGGSEGYFKCEFELLVAKKLFEFCGSFMVDCRPINTENEKEKFGGIAEASKYLFKFSELTNSEIWEVHQKTRRMRLAVVGGCFRGVELTPESLNDDLSEEELRPWVDYLLRWAKTYYRDRILRSEGLDLLDDETMQSLDTLDFSNERREQNSEEMKDKGMNVIFDYVQKNGYRVGGGFGGSFHSGWQVAEFLLENDDIYENVMQKDVSHLEFYDGTILRGRKIEYPNHYYTSRPDTAIGIRDWY